MPEFDLQFTLFLLTNGVMIGLMYALIALGFVLIYKATDAINFAQGEFVMFAGFHRRRRRRICPARRSGLCARARGRRHGGARLRARAGRAAAADRPADHRRGDGDDRARGGAARHRDAGVRRRHARDRDADRRRPDRAGAGHAAAGRRWSAPRVSLVFLAGFTWFFLKSRIGIAMRAVADSQQVAMAMGINVRRYFALAWAMAGIVSALGRHRLGRDARGRQPARPGRPQGVSGGDPRRPRFDRSARWSAA